MPDELKISYDLNTLLTMLANHPLAALERAQTKFCQSLRSHRTVLYETIAITVGFVLELAKDEKRQDEFFDLEWWDQRKYQPNQNRLVLHATMYVFGVSSPECPNYEKARSYVTVVNYYLGIDIAPKAIPAELKKESPHRVGLRLKGEAEARPEVAEIAIPALPKAASHVAGTSRRVQPDLDEDGDDDEEELETDEDGDDAEGREPRPQPKVKNAVKDQPIKPPRYRFDERTELAVHAQGELERFFELEIGDTVNATIQRAPDEGESRRFTFLQVQWPDGGRRRVH